jgi:hypothetical protein
MSVAQSWQKSYTDNQRRPLEFKVGDRVFLKVLTMRGSNAVWEEGEA